MAEVEIVEGADDSAIAGWIADRLTAALAASEGRIAVTLPGGSTPFPIIGELAHTPLAWDRISIWPGDDRIVSEDHPASNVGKIRAALEPLGANIAPLTPQARPPHFALTWLGMGGDGHIASLFPSADPRVDEPDPVLRIRPEPLPPEAPFDRLTLSIPALVDTDAILFVIRGADKRAVLDKALAGESDLPVARLLSAARAPVTCFA